MPLPRIRLKRPRRPGVTTKNFSHTVTTIESNSAQQYKLSVPTPAASRAAVGNEVRKMFRKVQPMNMDDLMNKYLPGLDDPPNATYRIPQDLFRKVNAAATEAQMYKPMCTALDEILTAMSDKATPHLCFKVTNNMTQQRHKIADELPIMAPDISVCNRSLLESKDVFWKDTALAIEVKKNSSADPVTKFVSDQSEDTNVVPSITHDNSMSQVMDYARCMAYVNAKTRVFTLVLSAKNARVFVCDRAAVTFSESFNYHEHPDVLGKFLRRFSMANNAMRGFDPTVTDCLSPIENATVRKAFATWEVLRNKVQLEHQVNLPEIRGDSCRITAPKDGKDHVFLTLGEPIFTSVGLFSRGTRCWIAFDAAEGLQRDARNAVLIKDSWVQAGRIPEHKYYEGLQHVGQQDGIARYMFSAELDVNDHTTLNHEAAGVLPRQHMRNILGTIGRRLSQYMSTRELVQGILSAVQGHETAFKNGVLHRDISQHNILLPLIPGQGSGFIIDFDLALFTDPTKRDHNEGWDLTGTIQFMAIARLENLKVEHKAWHDLESFFWVLLYTVARHTNNSWNQDDVNKAKIIRLFDSAPDALVWIRSDFLRTTRGFVIHGNVPLMNCIKRLARMLFKSYPSEYELDEGKLSEYPTHEGFCAILSEELGHPGWPDDPPIPWQRPLYFDDG